MKILFSLTYYSPYVSGLTLYAKRLAEKLVTNGHECEAICFKNAKNLSSYERINKVGVRRVVPWFSFNKGFISGSWIFESFKLVKKNDVVIINLPQAEGCLTAIVAKLFNKNIIAIYHCEIVLTNKWLQKTLELANELTLWLANNVVTYTKDYADNSKLLKKYKKKLLFVYPPVIELRISNRENKRNGVVIGIAARLAQEKGVEYLLDAIPLLESKLGNIKVLIAGPTSPVGEIDYKNMILEMVKKYSEKVTFLGTVPEENMGDFYQTIDILVLPSVNSTESFGMVQVEAMMAGVPVVASDLPGVRIPIKVTGMGKLTPVRDSESLAKNIIEVVKHKNMYTINKSEVKKIFDINKTVSFYEKIF